MFTACQRACLTLLLSHMVRWNIRNRAEALGCENPSQFAKKAGLTYPLARRLWDDPEIDRIDVATLQAVAKALKVRNPFKLLEYSK